MTKRVLKDKIIPQKSWCFRALVILKNVLGFTTGKGSGAILGKPISSEEQNGSFCELEII